jgi:hypothetical protein
MSCHQNIEHNNMKIASECFENTEKFKYLGTSVTFGTEWVVFGLKT